MTVPFGVGPAGPVADADRGNLGTAAPVGRSPGRLAWDRLRAGRAARVSAALVVLVVLVAVCAPLLTRLEGTSPYALYPATINADLAGLPKGHWGGISAQHWFGVEPPYGRDLFARVVYGARTSLLVAVSCAVLVGVLGSVVGVVSGYIGGWVDSVCSRVMDTLLSFPQLFLPLALIPVFLSRLDSMGLSGNDTRVAVVVVLISLVSFSYLGRIVRSATIGLARRDFVVAARALGAGSGHILFRELLPNLTSTVLVYTTVAIPAFISLEAALSFLGVGVQIPIASWGQMISAAVSWYYVDPLYLAVPGLFLAVLVSATTVLADAVRDALDPRLVR